MSKHIFFIIIFLLVSFKILAETKSDTVSADSVSCTVVDENQEPLPYVIILMADTGGKVVKSITTDHDGVFKIAESDFQAYSVAVRFAGYKYQKLTAPLPSVIQLEPEANALKEVVVKGKKSVVKVSEGVFEIDVAQSGLQNQPEISDILAFLPGLVRVGNGMVASVISGNPLYILNGVEQRSYDRIRALRPDQVKSVSVNYYPPAKYSSQYGCVISIITNKQLNDYFSAQMIHASYIFGRDYGQDDMLNISVSKKKWDNFLVYNFSLPHSKNKATNQYDILNPQGEMVRSAISFNSENPLGSSHSVTESFTYRPNEKWTLTLQGDLSATNDKANGSVEEEYREQGQSPLHSSSEQKEDGNTLSANADLKVDYQIDDQQQISVTGGYLYAKSKSNTEKLTSGGQSSWIEGKNDYQAFSAKVEYNYNTSNGLSLNAGFQGSFIRNKGHSNYIYEDQSTPLYKTTSDYQDDDFSFFAGANKIWGKFFLSTSVRGSLVRSKYAQTDASDVTHSYFKFSPRVMVQWDLTSSFKLLGAVLTRNTKPTFRDLLPLTHYLNPYFYQQGNPSLKSCDTYTFSLGAMWWNRLLLQARFCHVDNAALWKVRESPELNGAVLNSPVNFDFNYWLFNAGYSERIGIFRFSYNVAFQYNLAKVDYLDSHAPRHPKTTVNLVNQFDITPKTLLSIDLAYTSKVGELGVVEEPKYGLSCWMRQCFFKDNRLMVTLQAKDLLHKSYSKKSILMGNIKTQSTPNMDSRYLILSVVYTFNGFKNTLRRENANQENQGRLDLLR